MIPSKITIDQHVVLPLKLDTPTMINYDPRLQAGKNLAKKSNDAVRPWDNSKENSPPDGAETPVIGGSALDVRKAVSSDQVFDPIKALFTNYRRKSDGELETIEDNYSPRV